jgi:Raf kinase inhibitor-like YbhB/YbcL family protein
MMNITSPAFQHNAPMPSTFTCDGENVNPPLEFTDVPESAQSLVLLMDDPDVPKNLKPDGMWDHWVIYNIKPTVTSIAENSTPPGEQGLNSGGENEYYGACPPDRQHRYFFKLFALDTELTFDDPSKVTKQMVIEAMQGHVIEEAELIGLYERV